MPYSIPCNYPTRAKTKKNTLQNHQLGAVILLNAEICIAHLKIYSLDQRRNEVHQIICLLKVSLGTARTMQFHSRNMKSCTEHRSQNVSQNNIIS
jgi:hypothetical protein